MKQGTAGHEAIWLFDGVCVLCLRAVRYTLRHEKAPVIRFVAIQSDEGKRLARSHGIDAEKPDTFLFIDKGRVLAKSDGVIALTQHLRGPARVLVLGRFVPRVIRDWLYDRVAQNRYRIFGKSEVCMMPDSATLDRFILPRRDT